MAFLSKNKAWTCALLNVLATPGLGSLMAKRFISGAGQLALSVSGFLLLMFWLVQKMRLFYGQIAGTTLPLNSGNTAGKWGVIIFMAAWFWTLITSIQIVRSISPEPIAAPPVIR